MKLIFASSDLWRSLNELIGAAQKPIVFPLMEAAVAFTTQLALALPQFAATGDDQAEARSLERELISELKTWHDDEGAMKLRLMTHDVGCVVGNLALAARRYAFPPQVATTALAEILLRDLTVAAVAFTTQLAIEEAERDAAEMRVLERAMILELEVPWGLFGRIPSSVDVQDGEPWGTSSEED